MGKTKETEADKFSVVNVKHLAQKAKVDYIKVHHNLAGRYNSLTENEKTILANALYDEVSKAFEFLGFNLREHTRIKD